MGARLEALPGQAAVEQEHERVGQALQVVAPAGRAAQVRVHARIAYRAPAASAYLQCLPIGMLSLFLHLFTAAAQYFALVLAVFFYSTTLKKRK